MDILVSRFTACDYIKESTETLLSSHGMSCIGKSVAKYIVLINIQYLVFSKVVLFSCWFGHCPDHDPRLRPERIFRAARHAKPALICESSGTCLC